MGLNCKPGDLAVIVKASQWQGWIVEVVSAVPGGSFVAPDGTPFTDRYGGDWLIKAPRPFGYRPFTKTCFAISPDSALRPIRPGDLTQEDVDALYLPQVIKQRDPEAA